MWRLAPQPLALGFLAAAVILFTLDAALETFSATALAGLIALTYGFSAMYTGRQQISPLLAIPACVTLGAITTILNWAGRRARGNKRAR
jgi:membrane-bound ClpP family serine protease